MNIKIRIKDNLKGMKNAIERMPITMILGIVFGLICITNDVKGWDWAYNELFSKLWKVFFIGALLSIAIYLRNESYDRDNIIKKYINWILGFLITLLYYISYRSDYELFIGLMGFTFLSSTFILYSARIGNNKNYKFYLIDIFRSLFISFLYSFVLYLGLIFIFTSINLLFELGLSGNIYYYIFISILSLFALPLFITNLPENDKIYNKRELGNIFSKLLKFILIPLLIIYTLILYIYFIKILLEGVLPSGVIGHLVIWYGLVSVGVLFFINNIDDDIFIKGFRKYFPKLQLISLIILFISIYQRINQYGFTINRYIILLGGIWISIIILNYGFNKKFKNIYVLYSLSIVLSIALIGPISAISVSKYSQNERLNEILMKNNMIDQGNIIAKSEIDGKDKAEISSIVRYLDNNHGLENINILKDQLKDIDDMNMVFGFPFTHLEDSNIYNNMDYNLDFTKNSLDIKDYRYMIESDEYTSMNQDIGEYNIDMDSSTGILSISKNGLKESIHIKEEILDIIELDKGNEIKNKSFFIENDLGFKIQITNLWANIIDEKEIELSDLRFIILLK